MGPMELSDGVVVLRPPTVADGDQVVAAIHASLDELAPWMPWATVDYDVAAHHEWVTGSRLRGDRPLLICEGDGTVVGATGINQVDVFNRRANLGYWVHSARTGRGYATRATRLVARWAVVELGLHRLDICMAVGNHASRAVAERVGAYHEGVLRAALLLHGEHHDAHSYSLLAPEVRAWPGDLVHV
jgi:ribosomal-protein-serine acetyltransferase